MQALRGALHTNQSELLKADEPSNSFSAWGEFQPDRIPAGWGALPRSILLSTFSGLQKSPSLLPVELIAPWLPTGRALPVPVRPERRWLTPQPTGALACGQSR